MKRTLPQRVGRSARPAHHGFSLVELMIAMSLGLIMVYAFFNVYLSSRTGMRRVEQLSTVQNSVRTAFEYLSNDAHAVGMAGCYTGSATPAKTNFTAPDLTNNYLVPIEGYDAVAAPSYPLTTSSTTTDWSTNIAAGVAPSIPFSGALSTGVAKGSDVLVLRTAVGRPLRLSADADGVASKYQIQIETLGGGTCTDGTSKVSGFCANSHALIASCSGARVFQVATAASAVGSSTLNITATSAGLATDHYVQATSEVFPLQTIIYYVAPSASGSTQSLYRRVFDGNDGATGAGEEQELIEDVENLQVTYGVDNPATTLNADGTPDLTVDSYEIANAVSDWSRVVAVRMSLLIKAREPVRADASVPASAPVNGVTITFPTTGDKFDRRVFTTTVALRNKVAY